MAIAAQLIVDGTVGASRLVGARSSGLSFEELLARPKWHDAAACCGRPDVDFFPTVGGDPLPAIAVCGDCPVRAECSEYADDDPNLSGVWGARLRRPARGIPPEPKPAAEPEPRGRRSAPAAHTLTPVPRSVRCSCGKRCRTVGLWRSHVRGSLEAHPDSTHELTSAEQDLPSDKNAFRVGSPRAAERPVWPPVFVHQRHSL